MPINFTCPHCGATTDVADRYAGTSGPCAKCGRQITIPRPGAAMAVAAPSSNSSIIVIVLAVMGVIVLGCGGLMVMALLPAIQSAREAGRKAVCSNNLKQINLALLQYESMYRKFPPAYVADKNGRPMHSWRVLILPFLEADDIYAQYDFDEPWDGPKNRQLAARMPHVFRCPASPDAQSIVTDYLFITGPGTMFVNDQSITMAQVRDGLSNTILVAEVSGADIHWMEPRDLEFQKMDFSPNPLPGRSIHSEHSNGAFVSFGDGRVHFLPSTTPQKDIEALITPDGGEIVFPF